MSRSNVKVALLSIASAAALGPFALTTAAERPRLVAVYVWTGGETPERATGFVVAPNRVVTVAHVLEDAVRVEVRRLGDVPGAPRAAAAIARSGRAAPAARRGGAAAIVRRDHTLDLALLRVPGATGPRVRFGDGDRELRLLVRDVLPAQLRRRISARLVDQPGRPRRPSLELGVTVSRGDSGAPVVGADGAIVGVIYARSTRRGATAYAVRGAGLRAIAGG